MSNPLSPPGRLQAQETLDRIQVDLPADLTVARILWGAVCGLAVLAALVSSGAGSLSGAALGAVLTVGLLWGFGRLLALLIQAMRRGYHYVGVLLLAGMTGGFSLMFQIGDATLLLTLLVSVFCALVYFLPLWWMAYAAPSLLLEQGTLTVRRGRRLEHLPLEGLDPDALPLRGLRDEERDWLLALVEVQVARRKDALAAEGHDLATPATPPPALEALRQS